jgi:hypothetical protein
MARSTGKSHVKTRPLSDVKGDLSHPRRKAAKAAIRLENDPRFLERVEKARKSIRAGRSVRLDQL